MPRKYEPNNQPKIRVRDELGRNLPVLKDLNPDDILKRYLADERSADIAQTLGVSRSALNQWLLKNCEEDWKDAQIARALTRKESAEDAMESATDALQLAKARELLKSAQWELERVCRRIYGEDKAQQVLVNPVLIIQMSGEAKQPAHDPMSLAHAQDDGQEGAVIDVQPQ
jgi:hypothetical protein